MAEQSYEQIIERVLHRQATIIAEDVKTRLSEYAKETMDEFYNDYSPKLYYRTHNLRNSHRAELKRESRAKNVFSRVAAVEFSTENMRYDTHAIANGGTEYDKAAVMHYDFDNGWHGAPVANFLVKKRLRPSPSKRMEKRIDSITKDFESGVYDIAMEEAFEKACSDIAKKLDKKLMKR